MNYIAERDRMTGAIAAHLQEASSMNPSDAWRTALTIWVHRDFLREVLSVGQDDSKGIPESD